jgi:hypothetical protein
MRIRSVLLATASAGAAVALSVGSAHAGEVTGNGKPTQAPAHTNSICAFSGLEDGSEGGPAGPGVTQNWGQIPKAIRDIIATQGEHPGDACNGHTGFLSGP